MHEKVLEQVGSDDLSVIAVWMPVLQSDNAAAGKDAEPLLPDDRVTHYWDGDNSLGKLYGRLLTLPSGRQLAWDIYFVYAPGVTWEEEPPMPTQWMHQLGRDERHLDGDALRGMIQELLGVEDSAVEETGLPRRSTSSFNASCIRTRISSTSSERNGGLVKSFFQISV